MLASQLPTDSPFYLAVSEGDGRWTLDRQLLAGVFDQLAAANWQRGGGKGPRPKPIDRPGVGGDKVKFGKGRSREELDALLEQHVGPRAATA